MIIGGSAINLSNLIWPDTTDLVQKERSVFLVQDFQNEDPLPTKRIMIFFGKRCFEDAAASRVYLAVLRGDGRYINGAHGRLPGGAKRRNGS